MNQGQCNTIGATPERERYIPNQVGRLERAITELEEEFGNLQGRLQDVRRDEAATCKETVEQPKEPPLSCPLAEYLRIQSNRIIKVIDRIRYQLEMLEL